MPGPLGQGRREEGNRVSKTLSLFWVRYPILFLHPAGGTLPAGREALEISSIEAILSDANTSRRGFPPVPGPFLAFGIFCSQSLHWEEHHRYRCFEVV